MGTENQRPQSGLMRFNSTITNSRTQEYLLSVLGEKKNSFVNNLTALVTNNVKLQECEPVSLMHAGIKATALDLPLDPNLGFAYVIPYRNNSAGKTEAQFQIGYKGFVQLAIRSGQFKLLNVTEIREGEITGEDILTGEMTFRRAEGREGLKTVGYVAYFRLTNGFEKMLYMSVEQIDAHAKRYSQTYGSGRDYIRNSSKWTTDFDAMARKTVLKLLLSKYAPMSVEMRDAVLSDQAVLGDNTARYVDNGDSGSLLPGFDKDSIRTPEDVNAALLRGQITAEEAEVISEGMENGPQQKTEESSATLFDAGKN